MWYLTINKNLNNKVEHSEQSMGKYWQHSLGQSETKVKIAINQYKPGIRTITE